MTPDRKFGTTWVVSRQQPSVGRRTQREAGSVNLDVQTPEVGDLAEIRQVLEQWQQDRGPLHLHPGDLGWYSLRGPAATAAAIRTWSHGPTLLAVALLDGPDLLRLAIDPGWCRDTSLASRIAADVNDAQGGIFGAGAATVEARGMYALTEQLAQDGWSPAEPWIPLHHDLAASSEVSGHQVEIVESRDTAEWAAVHWSAFRGTPIPDDRLQRLVEGWCLATESPFFEKARILLLRDDDGQAVAVTAVWSAGDGRPGLIEPLAVHQDHRGRRYGTVMTHAAVDALREMGSSSATVCAESSNTGAVATYLAAGFTAHPEVTDWHRSGRGVPSDV